MIAAVCPPTRSVPVVVSDVPLLRTARITGNALGSVARSRTAAGRSAPVPVTD